MAVTAVPVVLLLNMPVTPGEFKFLTSTKSVRLYKALVMKRSRNISPHLHFRYFYVHIKK